MAVRRFAFALSPCVRSLCTVRCVIRLLLLLVPLLFAACEKPLERAELVAINGAEPDTIDPALIRGQPEGRVAYCLWEGLTRYDENGDSVPGTAERWDLSPDGKRYTFHLRANAKWSNGEPLTAQDFVWSWLRAMRDPECDYRYQFFYIAGAKEYANAASDEVRPPAESVGLRAIDERTLEVTLNNPTPFFIDLCTFYTLMPVHRASLEYSEKRDQSWLRAGQWPNDGGPGAGKTKLVCNGPFVLEAWRLNDRIRVKKNPQYWDAANVKLNTIDLIPSPSPNTAFNFYHSGVADLMLDKSLVPTSLIDELKKRPDYHAAPVLATYFFRFNVKRKPWDDVRVRKAFALVVDKQLITEKVTRAGEPPADAFVPPGTGGYQPPTGLISRDPDLAKKLLAEAGYPCGAGFPVVTYLYTTRTDADEKIAVELQAMFDRELGIKIQLHRQEWASYLNVLSNLDFDFARSSWVADYNDPNTFLDMFTKESGNNNTGWIDPRYEDLIARAGQEVDQKKRFELFREAETLLVREATVIVPLYHYVVIMFYDDKRLGGVRPNLTDEHPFRTMYWKDKR
jgi:oligopeptide transport system substrate-binding protein